MNIVFYILVIIALVVLYFILSNLFEVIGRFSSKVWKELKENINGEGE